jgi:uridine kinase
MFEKIIVNVHTNTFSEAIEIEKGTLLSEIANIFQSKLPYRIIAAKVNNKVEELTKKVQKFSEIELLDMRDPNANLIYQRSACFIYIKAVKEILGHETKVLVENSLNQGLYTEIDGGIYIPAEKVKEIEKRMHKIIKSDCPIILEIKKVFKDKDEISIPIYSCGETFFEFNGLMVPSTGYIEYVELVKYEKGIILRHPDSKVPNCLPPYRDDKKLYQAFQETARWGKLMGISFVRELNEKIRNNEYKEIIQISEALHEKKIAEIADMIVKQKKRAILIAGPSSSGKTTFANRLYIQLRVNGIKPISIGTDDYFLERDKTPRDEDGNYNFEDIESIDIEMFNKNINDLLAGEEVDLPIFDFKLGRKVFGRKITKAEEGQAIVIEGIHGLNEKLSKNIPEDEKFKIYISPFTQINIDEYNRVPTTDARLIRRIVRDTRARNNPAQVTISQWPSVRKGEDKNIFPFNGEADVLFNSVHIYELAVLKKYAFPLLLSISPDEPEFSEAVRLLKFLKHFETIEDDSMILNNSILREFIGGSIFFDF